MKRCFKISKIETLAYKDSKKYIIKKRIYILYPFIYRMVIMKKSDFVPYSIHSKYNSFQEYIATFRSMHDVYESLYQYSKIHGYSNIIVKLEI